MRCKIKPKSEKTPKKKKKNIRVAKSRHQSNFLDVKIHPKKKVIGMVIPLPSMFWGGHQPSLAALGDGHLHQKKNKN